KNLTLSVRLNFQDRNGSFLKYNTGSGQSTEQLYEPFLLIDTKLTYSFRKFQIFLEATNLLDADYYDIGNVIQPGRWTIVGIEIR
ncbi:MAG: TonB-dependent receptor, partial [Bacteroidales bacterium]|nr:TonB-dependent receptor [Bacteroidales bacterium]